MHQISEPTFTKSVDQHSPNWSTCPKYLRRYLGVLYHMREECLLDDHCGGV
jgi:hypothetical protein